jgi:hypothetical protein
MPDRYLRQFIGDAATLAGSTRPASDYKVKVLAIRDYHHQPADPKFGLYDDLIVACVGDYTEAFKASTDPGRFAVQNSKHRGGCAVLTQATHFFKKGKHSHDRFDAFIPAEDVEVARVDKDGNITTREMSTDGTIHIHCGGGDYAGNDDVGDFSEGCQIIFNPPGYFKGKPSDPWYRFYNLVTNGLADHDQTVFPYKLIHVSELLP